MNDLVIKETKEIAQILSQSRIVPSFYKNEQDCFFALQLGRELGLSDYPVTCLMNIHVVNGRPALSADLMFARAKTHKDYAGSSIEYYTDKDCGLTCKVILKRKINDFFDEIVSEFSIADARIANLLGKDNWKFYPKRMLKSRAVSYAVRDLFPDAFAGMLSKEEAEDLETTEIVNNPISAAYSIEDESDESLKKEDEAIKQIIFKCDGIISSLINEGLDELSQKDIIAMRNRERADSGQWIAFEKFLEGKYKELSISNIKEEIRNIHEERNYDKTHIQNSIEKHLQKKTIASCNDLPKLLEYLDYLKNND